MLANFFGKSNPLNAILISVIFLGFFLATSIEAFVEGDNHIQIGSTFLLLGIFTFFFFCYNFILAKNKLTLNNSYGFLFFVLFFGLFPQTLLDRNEVFLNLIVLFFLRKIYSFRSAKEMHKKIFDSGFWLGILFLIAPTSVLYGLLILVSLILFQKINVKRILISLIGFISPVFCYFGYCFWNDQTVAFNKLFWWYSDYNFEIYTTPQILIPSLFLLVFITISIVFKTQKALSISGNDRKYWILVFLNFLVALTCFFIQENYKITALIGLFFPMSVILTNWLEALQNSFYKNLFLAVFMGCPVLLFFVNF